MELIQESVDLVVLFVFGIWMRWSVGPGMVVPRLNSMISSLNLIWWAILSESL